MTDRRNMELAATVPDAVRVSARFRRPAVLDLEPVRESQIRIREHSAPLSSDLRRLADSVDAYGHDIMDALASGNAERLLSLVERMPGSLRMLTAQLRVHAHTAEVFERELIALMGGQ